jgi:hypothetical protein
VIADVGHLQGLGVEGSKGGLSEFGLDRELKCYVGPRPLRQAVIQKEGLCFAKLLLLLLLVVAVVVVAARSSPAHTLRSWVRIPLEAWMSVCVYCVSAVLCAGSSLATGRSPVQGVQPTV